MKLLGFSGGMGVGKSTAVEFLRKQTKHPVYLIKFAQPLYDIQEYVYDKISSVVKRDASFTKDRKLLQWIGTEWGRNSISDSLWVDLWKAQALLRLKEDPNAIIVCDDVRFDNEAETIQSLGGSIVRLTSSHTEKRIDTKAGIVNHASEAGINGKYLNAHVQNDGTVQDFKNSLARVFMELGLTEKKEY